MPGISIDQPFLNRQAATDYFFNVMLGEEVNIDIYCQVPLLWSHYSRRIVCGENAVVSRLLVHPVIKVEQEGCESAAEDQNCAEAAYRMDL